MTAFSESENATGKTGATERIPVAQSNSMMSPKPKQSKDRTRD